MEKHYGVGVLGATGYSGTELIRLLLQHPRARVIALGGRQDAGKVAGLAIPSMPQLSMALDGEEMDPVVWRERGVQVVFSCLPHGVFAARAAAFLQAGLRVVDLSGDFRLRQPAAYPRHYHMDHPSPGLLDEAVYALADWDSADLTQARLVANPGCYATAILLATLPAARAGCIGAGPVQINAMSGVSGAGRGGKLTTQFAEIDSSVVPYKVGEEHAHLGEVGQALAAAGAAVPLTFNPYMVPMSRGILANVAIPLRQPMAAAELQDIYAQAYAERPFVQVLGPGRLPETRYVRGSNRCDLALRVVAEGRVLQVFSAIDNLIKGAAGQAVQNFNRMHGWDAALGLPAWGTVCA